MNGNRELEGSYSDTTVEESEDEEAMDVILIEVEEAPVEPDTETTDEQAGAVGTQASTSSQSAPDVPKDDSAKSEKENAEASEQEVKGGVKRSQDSDPEEDIEDGRLCIICMDAWSNSGDHRLSCLRCGHLFGYSCIVRWLQVGCSTGQRRCPQCNKKAHLRDIRMLYARKLQVIDTTERDRLREELEAVKQEKNRLELELARSHLNFKLHQLKIETLKRKLSELTRTSNSSSQLQGGLISDSGESESVRTRRLVLNHSVEICKNGGCRVLAYNSWMNLLCVSQRSTNNLFSGYGIKKIDTIDFRPTQFVFLHPKPIRDLAFNPQRNDILLSVSLDACAKLLNVSSNVVINGLSMDSPLWSCCWDANNSNMFFVGSQNGVVSQFDIRQTSIPICRLSVSGDLSPVTSIASLPACAGRVLPRGGLLVSKLNSCWAYQYQQGQFVGQRLPFDGPFTSLCYEPQTEHVLISTRPNTRSPHASHILCQLNQGDTDVICNPVHTFIGSTSQKLLSRPCQIMVPGDTLVAAHQESNNCVAIWSVSSGHMLLRLPASEPIIDLCPVQVNTTQYLATLSQKMLRIYNVT